MEGETGITRLVVTEKRAAGGIDFRGWGWPQVELSPRALHLVPNL